MQKILKLITRVIIFIRSMSEKYKTLDLTFSKRTLVIFLGDKSSYISAFEKDVLIDYISINETDYKNDKYKKFIDKYRKYRVFFVLDHASVKLNYADIPISHGILYSHPVVEFISKKFPKETLVSYNVYKTTKSEQEIWDTIFASIDLTSILSDLVDYTSANNFNISGIYFFPLNVPILSKNILNYIGKQTESELRIVVTVSNTTSVHLVVADGENVMSSYIFDFPKEKGDEYAQGIIEQAVIDALISLKNYIHHNQVTPHLIILAHDSLKNLIITKSKFEVSEVITLSPRDLPFPSVKNVEGDFEVDLALSYLLNKKVDYHATNDVVDEYTRLHEFNKFLSAPWYFLVTIAVFLLLTSQLQSFRKNKEASRLNQKFYLLSEEYRKSRKEYPDISSLEEVVNFYYAKKQLSKPQALPFDDITAIVKYMSSSFVIYKIHWEFGNNYKSYTIINAKYRSLSKSESLTIRDLNSEIEAIKKIVPQKTIRLIYNDNDILNSSGIVTIPIQIIIMN